MPIFRTVSKLSRFFQKIVNYPDRFKTVPIFPDNCQFSVGFQNCTDFPRLLLIFQMVSKMSGFFQVIVNFLDDFKTVRIYPDNCQFSRRCQIFLDDCQFSGRFQKCLDFSRSFRIFWMFPDAKPVWPNDLKHCSSCKRGQKVKVNEMIIKIMARKNIVKIKQIIAYTLCAFLISDILIIP